MPRARRRINFTGRRKILPAEYSFRPVPAESGFSGVVVEVRLNLAPRDYPVEAAVIIEAYHRDYYYRRFGCGTIGKPKTPARLHLDGLTDPLQVLFRIKVVSPHVTGLILASAERIVVGLDGQQPGDGDGRRPIFNLIEKHELNEELWNVEIQDETLPQLWLNNQVPKFKELLVNDPFVQGTILPMALRMVLKELIKDFGGDGGDDWKSLWTRYVREELQMEDPETDSDDPTSWIDDAVRKFCIKHKFIDRIKSGARR